jgi:hypothetical protein
VNFRYGALALVALAIGLAACSTSSNNGSNNNPLSGVTIVQPTAAPPTQTPTATPVPTATPTLAPQAVQALADPSFETEGAASRTFSSWVPCSYPHPNPTGTKTPLPAISPGLVTAAVVNATDPTFTVGSTPGPTTTATPLAVVSSSPHTGTYAALVYTGDGGDSVTFPPATAPVVSRAGVNGICQTFTVPASAVLTAFVNEGGNEDALNYGDQEGEIFPGPISSLATTTPIPLFTDLASQYLQPSTATNGYVMKGPYTLTGAPYNLAPGSTATVFFGAYDSSPANKYGMYMFVDDVTVTGIATTMSNARRSDALGHPSAPRP